MTVERLDVREGELLVQGRWSGVRGMRFLRPTLVVGDRQVLATLEHKPWAPQESGPWTAAFPWPDGAEALAGAWLEVAPSVIVPLGRVSGPGPGPGRPPAVAQPTGLQAAERRAEDAELASRSTEADRDRARGMFDEAVRDREAAIRTRDRLSHARDEAVTAQAEAERRRDAGIAEARRQRDEAVAQARHERDEARRAVQQARDEHDKVRGQRDEALAGHRVLEHALRNERAERERDREVPVVTTVASRTPAQSAERDDEAPIGIRAIPAARAAGAIGARAAAPRQADLQPFDRWALRVLATAAATCFVLLLLLLIRVFV